MKNKKHVVTLIFKDEPNCGFVKIGGIINPFFLENRMSGDVRKKIKCFVRYQKI